MKISREVKTAILVITSLLLIIYLFNYLKGENLFDSSRSFYTVYDNVEGLAPSTPVTISGLVVGKVQEIGFTDDGSGKVKIKLLVNSDFEFSKNSKAQLYETGLIGGKAIAIVPALDGGAMAQDGDSLESIVKAGLSELVNQKLTPLQEKIETMMESADALLSNLNDVFDEQTKTNLKHSISELGATISSFKNTSNTLNDLISDNKGKIDSTLQKFSEASSSMATITEELAQSNLGATVKELQTTLSNFKGILSSIEKGEGTMGKLLKDEGLYNNLKGATKEMEALLKDIKLHPKRYFRILSRKEIPYNENEN